MTRPEAGWCCRRGGLQAERQDGITGKGRPGLYTEPIELSLGRGWLVGVVAKTADGKDRMGRDQRQGLIDDMYKAFPALVQTVAPRMEASAEPA